MEGSCTSVGDYLINACTTGHFSSAFQQFPQLIIWPFYISFLMVNSRLTWQTKDLLSPYIYKHFQPEKVCEFGECKSLHIGSSHSSPAKSTGRKSRRTCDSDHICYLSTLVFLVCVSYTKYRIKLCFIDGKHWLLKSWNKIMFVQCVLSCFCFLFVMQKL